MFKVIKIVFVDFYNSFKTNELGFSARKSAAFYATLVATVVTIMFGAAASAVELVLAWLFFALLCLGIVTIQQIIDFKATRNTPKEAPKQSPEQAS